MERHAFYPGDLSNNSNSNVLTANEFTPDLQSSVIGIWKETPNIYSMVELRNMYMHSSNKLIIIRKILEQVMAGCERKGAHRHRRRSPNSEKFANYVTRSSC